MWLLYGIVTKGSIVIGIAATLAAGAWLLDNAEKAGAYRVAAQVTADALSETQQIHQRSLASARQQSETERQQCARLVAELQDVEDTPVTVDSSCWVQLSPSQDAPPPSR